MKQPQGKLNTNNIKTIRIPPKTNPQNTRNQENLQTHNTTSKNMYGANNKMGKIPYLHKCYGNGGLRRAHNPFLLQFSNFSLKIEIG